MKTSSALAALLACALLHPTAACAATREPADAPVRYHVVMDAAAKRWHVTAEFPHPDAGELEFWMPRWTAGAYHLADYGKFVEQLVARGPDGKALEVRRDGDDRFVVAAGGADPVTLDYTARPCAQKDLNENMILQVEGNRIRDDHGFLSPNSLLGFVKSDVDRPCEVQLDLPTGWKAATALPRRDDGVFTAPSWWRLEDSPCLFSPSQHTVSFEVAGVPHSVTCFGVNEERTQKIAEHCKKIVEAGRDWMQGLPYPRYDFLLAITPSGGGAGLEHSESTLIFCDPGIARTPEYDHFLAHEYFHAWCAERIHVQELERPDYTKPLRTGTIWVNEGLTEYFCRHLLVRAGLVTREQFFEDLLRQRAEAQALTSMAEQVHVPVATTSWTDVSRATEEKHYPGGCWTVFALDLEMRRASKGERGVADLLRFLYRCYAQHHRGFAEDAMPGIVDGIAQGNLDPFFAESIDGPKLPDVAERLGAIGCELVDGSEIRPVENPTPEQKAALERFFELPRAEE
jgi:predicted metalloprotease with PDZ domain